MLSRDSRIGTDYCQQKNLRGFGVDGWARAEVQATV